ncbi:MAG: hypothetical protein PHY15_06800 [Eubacteriales bacterium]|nr:hypothetical protein [Eubacteriales bacterium]
MCSKRKEIDISDLLTTFEIQAVRLVIKRLMKIDAKKKGADLKGIENTLFHVLNEYRSFDIEECIDANSNVDKIAFAEAMACLEMAIKEPIM